MSVLITAIVVSIAFIIGFAALPLFCWVVGSALGPISELVANLMFKVAALGIGPTYLEQGADDTYRLVPGDQSKGTPRKWTRWALVPFAFAYESTPDAWGHLHADPDRSECKALPDVGDGVAEAPIQRGGEKHYLENDADGLRVRLGAGLNRLKGSGLLDIHSESVQQGLADYGGDTQSFGVKAQAIGFGVFTFLGLGMGWVLFI